jgi:tRNA threonylcarbamoyladenosine biosynthesis protein TsaE
MKYIAHNLEEMHKIAADFATNLRPAEHGATVVGLYGDLGAGKTSFTQGLAAMLGVGDRVASPTFVIEKIYELKGVAASSQHLGGFTHLIHIDAYRLDHSSELLHLGWRDICADPRNLILIEWPERVADIMPPHTKITFATLEKQDEREVGIESL